MNICTKKRREYNSLFCFFLDICYNISRMWGNNMKQVDYSIFRHVNIFTDLSINLYIGDEKNVKHVIPTLLEELEITTLEQLFLAYDEGKFNDMRRSGNRTIKGVVELLRYVYLNEPLVADEFLDNKVIESYQENGSVKVINLLSRLGLTQDEILLFLSAIDLESNLTYIELFEQYISSSYCNSSLNNKDAILQNNLMSKLRIIIEYRKKENEFVLGKQSSKTLEQMETVLSTLINRRDSLNETISLLMNEITDLRKKIGKNNG